MRLGASRFQGSLNGMLATVFPPRIKGATVDLVLKSTGALFLFLAWAGLVPWDQLFITLAVAYLILSNMIVLSGAPVY